MFKKNIFIIRVSVLFNINKMNITNLKGNYSLFDIAANLSDEKFRGIYNSKKYHEDDLEDVLKRSEEYNVKKLLLGSGCLEDILESYKICEKSKHYYTTAGVHPCRATEAENSKLGFDKYYQEIESLIEKFKDKIIAVGECGLDYDRLNYSSKEDQLKHFPIHFEIAQKTGLPMYLHSRNTGGDFYRITKENRSKFSTGVVHSFTESEDVLQQYLSLDLYIGVNGCSLKTKENIEVVKKIPLDRIMLETDSPYCDIRNTHESFPLVKTKFDKIKKEKMKRGLICKDRNEPCQIIQVLEVVSSLKGVSEVELARISYENTLKMFSLNDD